MRKIALVISFAVSFISIEASPNTEPPACTCIYDLNGDGVVNNPDFLILLGNYGVLGENQNTDFDEDGKTGIRDIMLFIPNKGLPC